MAGGAVTDGFVIWGGVVPPDEAGGGFVDAIKTLVNGFNTPVAAGCKGGGLVSLRGCGQGCGFLVLHGFLGLLRANNLVAGEEYESDPDKRKRQGEGGELFHGVVRQLGGGSQEGGWLFPVAIPCGYCFLRR